MFYRYYVISTTTGADYLYYYRSTYNDKQDLYPHFNHGCDGIIVRNDTTGILEQYLNTAYQCLNRIRTVCMPDNDLDVLCLFWKSF